MRAVDKSYSKAQIYAFRAVSLIFLGLFFIGGIQLFVYRISLDQVGPFFIFNMTTDVIGILICLIMSVTIFADSQSSISSDFHFAILFVLAILAEACVLFFDESACVFHGFPELLFENRISNFFFFIATEFFIITWWRLFVFSCETKLSWFKYATIFIYSYCVLFSVIVILNLCGLPIVFDISPEGYYVRHWGEALNYVLFVVIVVATFIGFIQQKNLTVKQRVYSCIIISIPTLCSTLPVITPIPTTLYAGSLIGLILIYSSLYVSRGHLLVEQERRLAAQRSDIMLSQIQPHFLYNSLSAIMGIEGNPPETIDALAHFSHYLRENLSAINSQNRVPFSKEMEHVQSYLYLEKLRFGDRLNIEFGINATEFSLPPLTIQMLAENAVKHGITARDSGGTLFIATREEEKAFVICIEDDGAGFDVNAALNLDSSHVGLSNVIERVKLRCNGTIDIASVLGKGTKVIVTIPKEE